MPTVIDKSNPMGTLDQSYDNNFFTIIPSDTVNLRVPIQALYVAVEGDVRFINAQGETQTVAVDVGSPFYLGGVKRILATGTTATGLKGVANKALR